MGLFVGLIIAYPVLLFIIFALMLISPEMLNSILSFMVKLAPKKMYDPTNGLSAVYVANFGIFLLIVFISICIGIIVAKIKFKK